MFDEPTTTVTAASIASGGPEFLAFSDAKKRVPEIANFNASYGDAPAQALDMLRVLFFEFQNTWFRSEPKDGTHIPSLR
jgi:hypothetical protein